VQPRNDGAQQGAQFQPGQLQGGHPHDGRGFDRGADRGGDGRPPRGGPRGGRDMRSRRKYCVFCAEQVREIDYKDVNRLRRFLSERGKIEPRRKTGTCAKHQRRLGVALKNARHMALLVYTAGQIREMNAQVRSA
jgi:small subunit ribosomal protein S18